MRLLKIVLCMAAVAALTVTFIPTSAQGIECLLCDISLSRGVWGHGATCSAATSDLYNQAAAIPAQVCNSQYHSQCGIPTTTVTSSCYSSNGQKVVDGVVAFNCRSGATGSCIPGGPPLM